MLWLLLCRCRPGVRLERAGPATGWDEEARGWFGPWIAGGYDPRGRRAVAHGAEEREG